MYKRLADDGCDPFPLYSDGWFYWSFGSLIVIYAVSLPFIIKHIKRKKLNRMGKR